jgi:hypothetical protein
MVCEHGPRSEARVTDVCEHIEAERDLEVQRHLNTTDHDENGDNGED